MATVHKRLGEAVEDYLRYRATRFSPTGVQQEGYVLRRFVANIGDIQLRHLRAERVTDWFTNLLSDHTTRDGQHREPIKASTHNFYRARLNAFFTFAQQRGWLRTDPLAEISPQRIKRRQRQQPTRETLLRMIEVTTDPRDRAYLAAAMNTGLRANEIVRLRIGDVDIDQYTLQVEISKTHESDNMPMTIELATELRDWLPSYARTLGRPTHVDDYLFPARTHAVYAWEKDGEGRSRRTRRPSTWNPSKPVTHTERIVQDALRAVGLDTKGEGTHTIRRAVARIFFDDLSKDTGYDAALRTVSAFLHHASSATTEHYLQLSSERERRDKRLRGQPFLTAMAREGEVLPLRSKA